jgi:hypothetical protein
MKEKSGSLNFKLKVYVNLFVFLLIQVKLFIL